MVYWKFCSEITFLLSQVHHNEYQKFSEEVFLLPLYLLSCLPAPGKWSEWAVWPGSWGRLWEEASCSDFRHHLSQTQWLPSVGCRALSRPLVETKKCFYHKKINESLCEFLVTCILDMYMYGILHIPIFKSFSFKLNLALRLLWDFDRFHLIMP